MIHPVNLLSVKNQSVHLSDTPIAKRKQSDVLADQVAKFLADGGAIDTNCAPKKELSRSELRSLELDRRRAAVLEMNRKGMNVATIAYRLGVTAQSVHNYLRATTL